MRQFLAVDIPQPMRDRLAELQRELRDRTGWKWVRASGIHLTIRFLGDVDDRLDERARPAWRDAACRVAPFRFGLSEIGVFPPRGRPRVLWVGLDDERRGAGLGDLAASVERAARLVGFEPGNRPFRPHLTLARARGRAAALPSASRPEVGDEEARATELVLFRSELLPAGARYTALESFPLGS